MMKENEDDDVDNDDTVVFNVVDMKDISMHKVENNVNDEESIYSDEEDVTVIFEELQDI